MDWIFWTPAFALAQVRQDWAGVTNQESDRHSGGSRNPDGFFINPLPWREKTKVIPSRAGEGN